MLRRSLRDELWGLTSRPVRPGSFAQCARLLVGTATHLMLDLLTHESPAGGELAVLLDLRVGGLMVHDVLQVVLSLIGLAVLGWWAWSWQRRARAGA